MFAKSMQVKARIAGLKPFAFQPSVTNPWSMKPAQLCGSEVTVSVVVPGIGRELGGEREAHVRRAACRVHAEFEGQLFCPPLSPDNEGRGRVRFALAREQFVERLLRIRAFHQDDVDVAGGTVGVFDEALGRDRPPGRLVTARERTQAHSRNGDKGEQREKTSGKTHACRETWRGTVGKVKGKGSDVAGVGPPPTDRSHWHPPRTGFTRDLPAGLPDRRHRPP
jgi:hypothetical protein